MEIPFSKANISFEEFSNCIRAAFAAAQLQYPDYFLDIRYPKWAYSIQEIHDLYNDIQHETWLDLEIYTNDDEWGAETTDIGVFYEDGILKLYGVSNEQEPLLDF